MSFRWRTEAKGFGAENLDYTKDEIIKKSKYQHASIKVITQAEEYDIINNNLCLKQEYFMQFLKIKAYRNNYIIYISSLLLACIILGASLCGMVVNNQIQKNESDAINAFNRIEADLNLLENKIDNYILDLYSSRSLLRDFICFFGNDVETYLTKRLDNSDGVTQVTSVLSDLQRLVYNNQYTIKEIFFQSVKQVNQMFFADDQGASYKFGLSGSSAELPEGDITYGYVYTKKLMNPVDISKPMGSMQFVIDVSRCISGSVYFGAGQAALLSEDGSLYYPGAADEQTKQAFRKIYSGKDMRGVLRQGFLNKLHYCVYTSKEHGYKLISVMDTNQIIYNNQGLFALIVFGMAFVFFLLAAVIAVFMTRDARYLNRILVTIKDARCGNFKAVVLGNRKDELRMIAQELNEMYAQLNHYIETEYKLKLKQKDTEMKMLQRQVNPHFLYNTLEIIRSCALVNSDEEVAEAISNLGGMFRALVKAEDVITIGQELEILTRYLKIMEFKNAGSFFYQIDVPEDIRALKTVKFWLQPLCENFLCMAMIKHVISICLL